MGLFSNVVTLKTGMTYDDLQNTLEQKDYKNEKQKNRIQKNLIAAFATADTNNDNVLSKGEIVKYNIKSALVGAAIGLGSVALGRGAFLLAGKYQANKLADIVTKNVDLGKIFDEAIKKVGSKYNKLA